MNEWNNVEKKGLPKKDGNYLCVIKNGITNKFYYTTYFFAKNLYKVSKFDFHDKKGVASFYDHDSEWGYYDIDFVYAWMEIPAFVE